MKQLILISIGLILSFLTYSQNKLVKVEQNVYEYYVENDLYSQINYQYNNVSDCNLVLWIEKYNNDSLIIADKIKNYFFKQRGDWSLMGLIWDGNVNPFDPGLFYTFLKVIRPQEKFTVSILQKGGVKNDTDLINSMKKHIIIVNSTDIRGFVTDNRIDMFNYKLNSIIVLANWIKKNRP